MNNTCFPEAVNFSKTAPEIVNDYLQSIYNTVVVKNIVQRYKLRNSYNSQRIIEYFFDTADSLVSPTNIAEALNKHSDKKISHNTINKLIHFLTERYLLYSAPRYDIKGKELLTTNKKYYVIYLGLKNILQSTHYERDMGYKLENVVYFELLKRGSEVYVGKNKDRKADFMVQKTNNEGEYYQVSYTLNDGKTFEREFSSLRALRNSYPKYILTFDYDNALIDGIQKLM